MGQIFDSQIYTFVLFLIKGQVFFFLRLNDSAFSLVLKFKEHLAYGKFFKEKPLVR